MEEDEMAHGRRRKGKGVSLELTLGRVWENDKPILDSKTWANLPESMFPSLFRFLRWDDVFRFRAVCQDWSKFLHSPGFRMNWQKSPDQVPICFARYSYWNPSTEEWNGFRDNLLPSLSKAKSNIPMICSRCRRELNRSLTVVSAAEGYVLIQMYTSGSDESNVDDKCDGSTEGDIDPWLEHPSEWLLIVNPVLPLRKENIKAVRPCPNDRLGECRQEIIWDPKVCRYELLSSNMSENHNEIYMWSVVFHRYDFLLDKWEKIVTWTADRFSDMENSLFIQGKLVCLGRPLSAVKIRRYRIYGMELSEFGSVERMKLRAPKVPFHLAFAALFYYESMYILAGGTVHPVLSELKLCSFKVWTKREVFDSEDSWTEVTMMPSSMLRYLNHLNDVEDADDHFTCEAAGGFLCIANRNTNVVICDLKKLLWFKLEKHPLQTEGACLALCDPRFDVPLPSSLGMNGSGQ